MPVDSRQSALWFGTALLPDGWHERVRIVIAGGRIARIEAGVETGAGDERHAIAIPGLSNLHSHAFQRAMAGLTEVRGPGDDDFWSWRDLMYRFVARLQPDDLQVIAALAYAEMLECGFTRVGEFHYLHHAPDGSRYGRLAETAERMVAAASDTGIGMTLLPVLYCHGDCGGAPPRPDQNRFISSPDEYARLHEQSVLAAAALPDAVVGVAPHSLRAVTPEELAGAVALSNGGPIHIHAAEQVGEVESCVAWSGLRPVQWLLRNAGVDARWCLIHSTHMDVEEARGLAQSEAVAGLCSITEGSLGDGVFRGVDYLEASGRFGIGTDSNVLINAAEELRWLEYGQRLTRRSRNLLTASGRSTGRTLFDTALAGGAQALGVAAEPGSAGLHVGTSADIVSLDADNVALAARGGDALLDSWIFATSGSAVDCVWRHGRKVVRQGEHVQRAAIQARYRVTLRKLLA